MPGFSGQGIAYIAPRLANGLPGIFRDFGNASVFKITQSVDTVERNESRTGSRLPLRRMTKSQGGKLQIVGDEFNKENFALSTLGVATAVAAGTAVAGFVLPTGVAVGDVLALPAKNVSAVAIKDSASGSPKVLTLNTHYSLDPLAGSIKILDLTTGGALTQPLKADFTPGAVDVIGAFKSINTEYFLRLDGVNTDDNNKRGICDVFRVRFDPAKALDLISNDYLDFDLEGTILADLTRSAASAEGQFWSFTTAAA
jgi:hypothetical protein